MPRVKIEVHQGNYELTPRQLIYLVQSLEHVIELCQVTGHFEDEELDELDELVRKFKG